MVTREKCAKAAIRYMRESPYREYVILRLLGQAFMEGCMWMKEQKEKEDEVKLDQILLQLKQIKID